MPAQILASSCADEQKISQITPYMWIFDAFAEIWDINIFVDSPQNYPEQGLVDADAKSVTVHFFPQHKEPTMSDAEISGVFGYQFSAPRRSFAPNMLNTPNFSPTDSLFDFDRTVVAYKQRRTIYIPFDFLSAPWRGAEEVLTIILYYCISKIYSPYNQPELRYGAEFTAFLKENKASCATREEFIQFADYLRKDLTPAYVASSKTTAIAIQETEEQWTVKLREIEELEKYLEWLKGRVNTKEAIGDEYDELVSINGVKTVLVEKDCVEVITERLTHRFPHDFDNQTTSDIGAYRLIIPLGKPLTAQAPEVHYYDKGPFRAPFVHPGQRYVCYGNDINGLIAEMMGDCNIPLLVHTILSFLRFVSTKPYPWGGTESLPDLLCRETVSVNREEMREKFIESVWNIRIDRLESVTKQNITAASDRITALHSIYERHRKESQNLTGILEHIEAIHENFRTHMIAEFDALVAHPAIIKILAQEDALLLWLHPEGRNYPIVLRIPRNGMLRMINPYNHTGKGETHQLYLCEEHAKDIRQTLATCGFADAVTKVIEYIRVPEPLY